MGMKRKKPGIVQGYVSAKARFKKMQDENYKKRLEFEEDYEPIISDARNIGKGLVKGMRAVGKSVKKYGPKKAGKLPRMFP